MSESSGLVLMYSICKIVLSLMTASFLLNIYVEYIHIENICVVIYFLKVIYFQLVAVVHNFHPSTQEAELGDLCETMASLVYIVNCRPARATERPGLQKQTTKLLPQLRL